MSKELSEETKYEFNVFARQLNKDLSNLMEYLRQQDEDNKPILYVGRHLKKVILPYDEYQKMCQRLEAIDNAKPSEALECLEWLIKNYIGNDYYKYEEELTTIKQSLIKSQEQEKVIEIIFEKNVNITSLKAYDLEEYNMVYENKLTQEEFDLLKRYCDEIR